jgi:hypothetical protein
MAMALDTLAYARRLREAGFSEQQAEGQAEALAAAMTDTLATKQDVDAAIAAVRHDVHELELRMESGFAAVRHEMRELKSRMEVRFADLERRMTIRLGGLMMAGIAVVSALNRLS